MRNSSSLDWLRFMHTPNDYRVSHYLVFEWRWIDGGYNSMELYFYGDGTYAYIWGAEATDRTFSGTWYNNWRDFRDRIDGQPFYMRRQ